MTRSPESSNSTRSSRNWSCYRSSRKSAHVFCIRTGVTNRHRYIVSIPDGARHASAGKSCERRKNGHSNGSPRMQYAGSFKRTGGRATAVCPLLRRPNFLFSFRSSSESGLVHASFLPRGWRLSGRHSVGIQRKRLVTGEAAMVSIGNWH